MNKALLLDAIKAVAPEAHIAGGAVRDMITGRPIKDIDVFIHKEHLSEAMDVLTTKLGAEWVSTVNFEYLASDPRVHGSRTFTLDGEEINLITLAEPLCLTDNLERFDFGICQAAFDGDKVINTRAFDVDKRNETFTLTRCESKAQYDLSMARWARLAEKYEGWQLVIPEEFTKYKPDY